MLETTYCAEGIGVTIVVKGPVIGAYVELYEVDVGWSRVPRIVLCFGPNDWIEFKGITFADGGGDFHLPAPFGCDCMITDISDRHWDTAKYEIEFDSSYSRQGVFHAKSMHRTTALQTWPEDYNL